MGSRDKTAFKDDSLFTLHHLAILLAVEEARVFVAKVVQVLAEELGRLLENPGHLFRGSVDQDHFGDIDDIRLVWLLRQVALVNVQSLQIDAADELAMRLAKLLHEAEDLLRVLLMLELLQVVEQLVQNLCE